MNSNGNNDDMLRAALQRRAERMAPAKGWEERVLAESAKPRRRFRPIWLAIPGAVAAVAAVVIALLMPSAPEIPITRSEMLIAEVDAPPPVRTREELTVTEPAPQESKTPRRTRARKQQTAEVTIVTDELEIEESMTVEQELEALFAMAESDIEMVNAFSSSFDDMDPIIISTNIIDLQ